ncbi:MAG: hypothetical protein H6828_05835 [Planctomycetes bacterium]|nr:hypothetical protein [Planctomycetota bacterium]
MQVVKLALALVLAVALQGCRIGPVVTLWPSPLPGPRLVAWPADASGATWCCAYEEPEARHVLEAGAPELLERAAPAGGALGSLTLLLPRDASPTLRGEASRLAATVGAERPDAFVLTVPVSFDTRAVDDLDALHHALVAERAARGRAGEALPPYPGSDVVADLLLERSVARVGVLALDAPTPRFVLVAQAPNGELLTRNATANDLRAQVEALDADLAASSAGGTADAGATRTAASSLVRLAVPIDASADTVRACQELAAWVQDAEPFRTGTAPDPALREHARAELRFVPDAPTSEADALQDDLALLVLLAGF